MFKKNK